MSRAFSFLILAALFLAACSSAPPATDPTPDLNAIRTEVAATVIAQVPQICALTPTATFPPTNTPPATATTAAELAPSQTPVTVTPVSTLPDQARWVSQTIQDGTRFAPGESFTMTWKIQNAGTTTWTTAYRLRFFSGNAFGAPEEIMLDREVPPNDIVDITVQMKAPAVAGEYRSDWVMANESLSNFNQPVFLKIVVGTPTATATQTLAPPTATTAPTETATPEQ